MSKKVTTKAHKSKASETTKLKSASKTTKAAGSVSRKGISKGDVERSSVTGKFVAAQTGRVIKSSPAKPRLGKERIQTAVRSYVRRDARAGRLSD